MTRFIVNRLIWFVPMLLAVYTISFGMLRAAPGKPFETERSMMPEVRRQLEDKYYLNDPWPVAYVCTLRDMVTLRGQPSMFYRDQNVLKDILIPAFPVSLGLGLLALSISVLAGLAAGIFSAVRRYTFLDHLVTSGALLGISLPSFVIAWLLMMVFSFWLALLPVGGWGSWTQLLLPAISLAAFPTAYIARLTRNSLLDVLPADYVRTAYCKGLHPAEVVLVHALKNAFLPVLSYLGPAAAAIFTGSFVVERIFVIPGVGHHFVQSALNRDYPLILAAVMLYSALLILMNLLVDIGYAWLDPRIRYD